MKIHQLRYLMAVSDAGSVRAGARALGVTQAAVTQGLRELERDCQLALLVRQPHGVQLTAAGLDLLGHAQRSLHELQMAEKAMARHRNQGQTQRLSVGVTPWVAEVFMPYVLPAFMAELPHVQLELFDGLSALAYPRLRDGRLDLMIGRMAAPEVMHGLQASALFNYEMTVIARQGHPRAQARSMAELMDQNWVLNFVPEESTEHMDNLFGQHDCQVPAQRIHLAHSASLLMTLVRQTDMLSFCPWPLVETPYQRNSILALSLRESFRSHQVGVIRHEQVLLNYVAHRFVKHFMQQVHMCSQSSDPDMRRVFRSIELSSTTLTL